MMKVALSQGYVALVDEQDMPRISLHAWWILKKKRKDGSLYLRAFTTIKRKTILMHRFILEAPLDAQVDHLDFDALNNRRANLRICNGSQNSAHNRACGKLGFRGVSLRHHTKDGRPRYRAEVSHHGVVTRGALYDEPIAAAREYDAIASKIHGKFAFINFPAETSV